MSMTKKDLKNKYIEWNKKNGFNAYQKNTEIFNKMQELARECGLPVYCSMDSLLMQLITTKYEDKALTLYKEYYNNEGKQNSLMELALLTDNFNI